jgi:hypothetical protein
VVLERNDIPILDLPAIESSVSQNDQVFRGIGLGLTAQAI